MNRHLLIFWSAIMAAHVTGAIAWCWMMPGGFGLDEPREWVNRVVPAIVVLGAIGARVLLARSHTRIVAAVLAGFGAVWVSAAVTARILFPISFAWLWLAPLAIGFVMLIAWRWS